jgi:hypothetical protein
VTTTAVNATGATDTTVLGGQVYDYYVNVTCMGTGAACAAPYTGAGAGPNSNEVATLIPPTAPPAPTISIGSVAENINPDGTQTVVAKWTDTNPVGQWFSFSDGNNFLSQGFIAPGPTTFAEEWTGPASTVVIFNATDAAGVSASQKEM